LLKFLVRPKVAGGFETASKLDRWILQVWRSNPHRPGAKLN
jgi:hypothetical protein